MLKSILLISIISTVYVSCQDIGSLGGLGDFNSVINNIIQ
jgi:hypothetical protein